MGRRQAAVDATRARILAAAGRVRELTLEAVARKAGVTRATVYHQFGSRRALLEALFDDIALRGGMHDLRNAFAHPDPLDALAAFVETFARFWARARPTHRRLQAQGVLDAELGRALAARQEWRRQGLRVITERLRTPVSQETVDVLFTLTSFHVFDTLAGAKREPTDVAPIVLRLARAAIGLP